MIVYQYYRIELMYIRVYFKGETPNFFGVLCPPTINVSLHFNKEVLKIYEIWSFMSYNFFKKFSQIFPEIFSTFANGKNSPILLY